MSAVKTFIAAFCTGCVLLGLLSILVPESRLSKTLKYAFSLCFLCLCLSAAVKISGIDMPDIRLTENNFEDERLSAASARTVFASALENANIKFSKITVFTDKNEQGGISITKVYVYTACAYDEVSAVIGSDDYDLVVLNE